MKVNTNDSCTKCIDKCVDCDRQLARAFDGAIENRKQYFGLPHWRYPRVYAYTCMYESKGEKELKEKKKRRERVKMYSERRKMLFNRIYMVERERKKNKIYIYMCVYIYIYIHTYIYMYIYIYRSYEGECARACDFFLDRRWPLPRDIEITLTVLSLYVCDSWEACLRISVWCVLSFFFFFFFFFGNFCLREFLSALLSSLLLLLLLYVCYNRGYSLFLMSLISSIIKALLSSRKEEKKL